MLKIPAAAANHSTYKGLVVSANAEIEAIISDFEFLDDWEQRYQYLTELGEALPTMPEAEKIDANRVKACMSKVWVKAHPSEDGTIVFNGDCDTAIIKGVVALLVQLYSHKTAQEILDLDVDDMFERLALAENLSPNRHVGVYAIVEVMKDQVRAFA
ncbi:SufE family protein [Thiolinea disciformis]|uniref:SufE family protein n=1 Tax=Thiolinea disciformis TaxID=125614 RepID=UPI000A019AEA|nr:SufE family protein [Thiolinea disciformis]